MIFCFNVIKHASSDVLQDQLELVSDVERFRLAEIFRRRVDGVVIYFFMSDFNFFDDASEFSVCSIYVVFIFS